MNHILQIFAMKKIELCTVLFQMYEFSQNFLTGGGERGRRRPAAGVSALSGSAGSNLYCELAHLVNWFDPLWVHARVLGRMATLVSSDLCRLRTKNRFGSMWEGSGSPKNTPEN